MVTVKGFSITNKTKSRSVSFAAEWASLND